jgi:hypothetical protein
MRRTTIRWRLRPVRFYSVKWIDDFFRGQPGTTDVVSHMEKRLAAGTDDVPYAVGFRNGTMRAVYPSVDDPRIASRSSRMRRASAC